MESFDLDKTLIRFLGKTGPSDWTIRDAVQGTAIFGAIGSGKTSGSGQLIAQKFLSNGFGGLVLTAKPDEKELWQDYCRKSNRLNDLIVIEPGGDKSFNFLEYESSSSNRGGALTSNLVQVLKTVIKASEDKEGGKANDSFWETALDMLMFNVIDLCRLAYGTVTVQLMFDIALTAPKGKDPTASKSGHEEVKENAFIKALKAAQSNITRQIEKWHQTLSSGEILLLEDPIIYEREILNAIPDAKLLRFIDQFFIDNYRSIGEKTRAIIEFSFTGLLFRLLQEPFYTLFCKHASNVTPDDCLKGKIILINLPVKEYHKVGRDIQIMFKYIWLRAMEKRNIKANGRPVFLWADEAQLFIFENDAESQATARSSRIATVYISQNLPNFYVNMGGDKAEYKVKALLGNFGTKVFHANTDVDTNRYASDLIGDTYIENPSSSVTSGQNFSITDGTTRQLQKMIRPERFVGLLSGSSINQFKVQGFVHRQGQPFHNKQNFDLITFQQSS